ncbi:hypothetical protein B0H12DRAFT_1289384 [Mycena haematopus]|nr:hypothetical protein B0H12DRAFT_1289384 [Mycena haematopus]
MAHHGSLYNLQLEVSDTFRPTFPQELIDLVLGNTDKESLKSCALVARSFRPTSQMLIFSDLTIGPSGCDSIEALQCLADVLSASSHLALHVRTLRLVQAGLYEPCVWMQSNVFPTILCKFTNLESLNAGIYNWDFLHSNCEQAIYTLITQSSLSSIHFKGARLQRNARLLSLLQSFPTSLKSASFSDFWADSHFRPKSTCAVLHQLCLSSLHLDSIAPMLFDWAIRNVDPTCLRHLHTTVNENTINLVQQLLDSAVYVETYHLTFWSIFSHDETPNLEKMQGLRTLEISVELDWEEIVEVEGEGRRNPLNDMMRTLSTVPHNVEHLVFNLDIWNPDDLCYFMESAPFAHLGEDRPALRDVVVRIVSRYDNRLALERGIRYLEAVLESSDHPVFDIILDSEQDLEHRPIFLTLTLTLLDTTKPRRNSADRLIQRGFTNQDYTFKYSAIFLTKASVSCRPVRGRKPARLALYIHNIFQFPEADDRGTPVASFSPLDASAESAKGLHQTGMGTWMTAPRSRAELIRAKKRGIQYPTIEKKARGVSGMGGAGGTVGRMLQIERVLRTAEDERVVTSRDRDGGINLNAKLYNLQLEVSDTFRPTFPQELIDLVLGNTDKESLKSCALVARSFRPTSQMLIFSDFTILPSGCDNIPALQRLADVLSDSPHLARHVRTLHLVQPKFNEPCVWIQSDILPRILHQFTDLESLNVWIYNWDDSHANCEQAIYTLITRSSLSSIQFKGARLQTKARLLSWLQSFPTSLKSASFLNLWDNRYLSFHDDSKSAFAELHQLCLSSLHLDSLAPMLFDWAIRTVDPKCLRYLYTTVCEDTMNVVQQLLDNAVYVETYHLTFWSIFSHDENLNIEKMQGLRTLEISVQLNWEAIVEAEGEGRHNPLNDMMHTLSTVPHNVEHLVFNLHIWNPDELYYFVESVPFAHHGKDRPALRDVVVRIVSRYDNRLALERGIRYLEAVLGRLYKRGMLTVIAVRPPSRDDN